MIVTMEYIDVLDQTDLLTNMITQSDVYEQYKATYYKMKGDDKAQQLIRTFSHMKDRHEEIERFGSYYPDYTKIMTQIRAAKREMDMHPTIAKYKIAERQFQQFLDEISEIIAKSVSNQILVPKENGLYSDNSCSTGGCATGGSCGCSAS